MLLRRLGPGHGREPRHKVLPGVSDIGLHQAFEPTTTLTPRVHRPRRSVPSQRLRRRPGLIYQCLLLELDVHASSLQSVVALAPKDGSSLASLAVALLK